MADLAQLEQVPSGPAAVPLNAHLGLPLGRRSPFVVAGHEDLELEHLVELLELDVGRAQPLELEDQVLYLEQLDHVLATTHAGNDAGMLRNGTNVSRSVANAMLTTSWKGQVACNCGLPSIVAVAVV